MKKVLWMLPLLGSLLFGTVASAQNAGDIQFTSSHVNLLNKRIAELETRLTSVEASEASFGKNSAAQNNNNGCKSGNCGKGAAKGAGCWCTPDAGLVASGELLLLRWADDDEDTGQNALHSGSRWTLGYMTGAGRTLRARYFEFATIEDGGTDEYRLETIDVEMASRFTLGCNLYGEFSAGARWAQLEDEEDGHRWNDTLGMVVGAELRADMPFNLTMYSGVRISHQFGAEENFSNENSEFDILELRAGTEYRRNNIFVRGGYETQSVGQAHGGDYGLAGISFAAGFDR